MFGQNLRFSWVMADDKWFKTQNHDHQGLEQWRLMILSFAFYVELIECVCWSYFCLTKTYHKESMWNIFFLLSIVRYGYFHAVSFHQHLKIFSCRMSIERKVWLRNKLTSFQTTNQVPVTGLITGRVSCGLTWWAEWLCLSRLHLFTNALLQREDLKRLTPDDRCKTLLNLIIKQRALEWVLSCVLRLLQSKNVFRQ